MVTDENDTEKSPVIKDLVTLPFVVLFLILSGFYKLVFCLPLFLLHGATRRSLFAFLKESYGSLSKDYQEQVRSRYDYSMY